MEAVEGDALASAWCDRPAAPAVLLMLMDEKGVSTTVKAAAGAIEDDAAVTATSMTACLAAILLLRFFIVSLLQRTYENAMCNVLKLQNSSTNFSEAMRMCVIERASIEIWRSDADGVLLAVWYRKDGRKCIVINERRESGI